MIHGNETLTLLEGMKKTTEEMIQEDIEETNKAPIGSRMRGIYRGSQLALEYTLKELDRIISHIRTEIDYDLDQMALDNSRGEHDTLKVGGE